MTSKKFSLWLSLVFIFMTICLGPALVSAGIKIFDITNPFLRKIPMAVPVFRAMTPVPAEKERTTDIADQVSNMLEFTGYFKMLDRGAFLYDAQASGIMENKLNFGNWTAIGAELLITGGVQVIGDELVMDLLLFDTFKAKRLVGRRYRATLADSRKIVRRFCSEVMKVLTGYPGMFNSRLAFVSNGSGHKEIYTCEFDGGNVRQVTKKGSITSFPAWTADARYMAFTSFINGPSQIFIRDLAGGIEKHLAYKGAQIAPSWRPNGFEFAATLSHASDQEIYLLTGGGKIIKRLTKSRGIDVEASWAPDGKRFAFVSNRAGTPQIYIQEVDSGRVTRLTFEGQYNTQPNWSPKGDRIAFSSMQGGRIDIVVIDTKGSNPIQLTQDHGDNEAPSWSPDGSLIAFSSTREGRSRIYVMTAYGTEQRRLLSLPGEQSQPKWSPNMPQ